MQLAPATNGAESALGPAWTRRAVLPEVTVQVDPEGVPSASPTTTAGFSDAFASVSTAAVSVTVPVPAPAELNVTKELGCGAPLVGPAMTPLSVSDTVVAGDVGREFDELLQAEVVSTSAVNSAQNRRPFIRASGR